jgi:hypothetical protein
MKKTKLPIALALSALAVCLAGLAATSGRAEPPAAPAATVAATNTVPAVTKDSSDAKPAAVSHQITGAELYSIHCNRCHSERYPTERTAAQWKTIMLHMQIRANLPVAQSRLILKYLQDNSGR